MQLHDHFDVANLIGHPAFEHLARALEVYDMARHARLLDLSAHSWFDCLYVSAKLQVYRREELKHCVQAIVLFQAMMEKVPFFVPHIGSGLNPTKRKFFSDSWNDLLKQIVDSTARSAAQAAFDEYETRFYQGFRNPIIHGRQVVDIQKVDGIRVCAVYEGMLQGWRAYDYLLTEAFAPEQIHEPSWAIMCSAHNIADHLDAASYPDLQALSRGFAQNHLEGARAAANEYKM
jgi:hypothetical protein